MGKQTKNKSLENKSAGFWIKLLSRLIDILPIAVITVGIAFALMQHSITGNSTNKIWHFEEPYKFYVWGIILMLMISIQFIIVPLLSGGQTLAQFILRIKVISEEGSIKKGILKREVFFSMAWLLSSILVFSIINHTLISKYAATKQNDIKFTTIESLRVGIVSTVGTLTMFIQMVIGISVLVRKDKKGFHDLYAKTKIVFVDKYIEKEVIDETIVERIKPKPYKNIEVEWVK